MNTLKPWLVLSREYGEVVPVLDGTGPIEYGRDHVFVEAETRTDALVLGVAMMRKSKSKYFNHYGDENPYAGTKVVSQLCPAHGASCLEWIRDHYECSKCKSILEAR